MACIRLFCDSNKSNKGRVKPCILERSVGPPLQFEHQIQQKPNLYSQEPQERPSVLEYRRIYIKVPRHQKQQLFHLVYMQGLKIKEAAKIIGIKYPTAKTIIFHDREKRRAKKEVSGKICKHTEPKWGRKYKLRIISSIANEIIEITDQVIEKSSL